MMPMLAVYAHHHRLLGAHDIDFESSPYSFEDKMIQSCKPVSGENLIGEGLEFLPSKLSRNLFWISPCADCEFCNSHPLFWADEDCVALEGECATALELKQ